jgi:1-acyl-sn-glycerol-3-phosphate acyltransferase
VADRLNKAMQQELQELEQHSRQMAERFGLPWDIEISQKGDSEQRLRQVQSVLKQCAILQGNAADSQATLAESWQVLTRRLKEEKLFDSFRLLLQAVGSFGVPTEVDSFGYSKEFDTIFRPVFDFLFEQYWRVKVEGVANIPSEGAAIVVANHAGLLPFDAFMLREAVRREHSSGRSPRFLIEDWFYKRPILSVAMSRLGFSRACPENARSMLEAGELLGLFPEGTQGVAKPFKERYKIQRFGRGGTVRLAAEFGAPVIPAAVVGSEEIYPLLWKSERLSRVFGFRFFPITPLFPFAGPLALMPLPSAWTIRFCEPMTVKLPAQQGGQYDLELHSQNEAIRSAVQQAALELFASRRSSFFQ